MGIFDRFKKKDKREPVKTMVIGMYMTKEKSTIAKIYGKDAMKGEKLIARIQASIMPLYFAKVNQSANSNFKGTSVTQKNIIYLPLAIDHRTLETGRQYKFFLEDGLVRSISTVHGKPKLKPSAYDKQKAKSSKKKKGKK